MTSLYLECLLLVGLLICAVQSQIPSSNIANAVHVAGVNLGVKRDRDRQRFEDGTDRLTGGRAQDQLQQFHGRRPKSSDISRVANQVLDITQHLLQDGFTIDNVTSDITVVAVQEALMFMGVCELPTVYKCDPLSPYRTVDGSCNNLGNPEWGKSNVAQRRDLGPAYESGTVGDPRVTGVSGRPLPNPRTVSNVVHSNINGITVNASVSLHTFQMGQFLAHDIIFTPTETGQYGATISCCGEIDRPECIPIKVPRGDPRFADGTCFSIVRSAAANPGCTPGFRQQQNQITSYIDGSNVYGSTDDDLKALRDGEYLRKSRENNLPRNPDQGCDINHSGEFCHLAGDARVDVVPSLASYHTLFMLEHNRIVDALKKVNPGWNVEKLFQEARKINIAQMQHIIYNGFLSAFLSRDTIATYKLRSLNNGYSTSYDKTRDATIANGFGIAYRMGHTWIPTYMDLYSDLSTRQSGPEMGPFDVVDTFNNPHLTFLNQRTGCPALLKWMTSQASPATDRVVEDSARNRLFEDSTGASFDLAALNILRGRDHGDPPYGDYRVSCGLSALTANWDSLVDHKPRETSLLRQVYNDPRDIDLFTGLLTEKSISGSSLGSTLSCILGREFQNLKEGDSYWYERPEPQGFPKEQLNEIRKTSLSAVLCANLGLTHIQMDAFKVPASKDKCIPIYVPNGDSFFKKGTCMNVKRSTPAFDVNCNTLTGPRQQENQITSYIDASNVYGSSAAELIKLRNSSFPEYMAVSSGDNLPAGDDNSSCTLTVTGESCSIAGDSRVNVVPSLGSYHTLFVQEHNRIVDLLKGKGWNNSEELFQEARKINIAQIQHITYNEYLSWLLTRNVMTSSGLLSNGTKVTSFTGYNSTINADIANDFGIAYRIGHSWITNQMTLHTESTETSDINDPDVKNIENTYHNPHMLYMRGRTGTHRMLKWMTETNCPKTDRFVEDGARNKLFLSNNVSYDLAALNINRGRDHGVPPYWKYRTELCGESLADPNSWTSLTWHDNTTIAQLKSVYQSPMDIDLWTGLVTEKNSTLIVGPTLNCILLAQFKALKNEDRYWFERPEPEGFSIAKLTAIKRPPCQLYCVRTFMMTISLFRLMRSSGQTPQRMWPFPAHRYQNWISALGVKSTKRNMDTGKDALTNKVEHILLVMKRCKIHDDYDHIFFGLF